jgi:hypothetical protein
MGQIIWTGRILKFKILFMLDWKALYGMLEIDISDLRQFCRKKNKFFKNFENI